MSRVLHSLALICVLSLSASPALASKKAEGAKKAPAQPKAQERDKAQLAFQRDLVSVLALGGDPQRLLGAAVLARPLFNQTPSNT